MDKVAIGALLDEYERAIIDLQKTIEGISNQELTTDVDTKTADPNCKSIQAILSHYWSGILNFKIDFKTGYVEDQ